jgi:hypothetical protein
MKKKMNERKMKWQNKRKRERKKKRNKEEERTNEISFVRSFFKERRERPREGRENADDEDRWEDVRWEEDRRTKREREWLRSQWLGKQQIWGRLNGWEREPERKEEAPRETPRTGELCETFGVDGGVEWAPARERDRTERWEGEKQGRTDRETDGDGLCVRKEWLWMLDRKWPRGD